MHLNILIFRAKGSEKERNLDIVIFANIVFLMFLSIQSMT